MNCETDQRSFIHVWSNQNEKKKVFDEIFLDVDGWTFVNSGINDGRNIAVKTINKERSCKVMILEKWYKTPNAFLN